MNPPQPTFGPQMLPDIEHHLHLRELNVTEASLIDQHPAWLQKKEAMELRPFEAAVIRWLRRQLVRASSPYEAANVGVLLVGERGHTAVVNHQFDHIGGGLVSLSDGVAIAFGDYDPEGMDPGEEHCRGWMITATGLGDRCSRETYTVIAPKGSDYLSARQAGTLGAAQHWFHHFPGHEVELFGAYGAARVSTADPLVAEAFFVEWGEYQDTQEDAGEAIRDSLEEGMRTLGETSARLGCKPEELLSTLIRGVADATQDPKRCVAAASLVAELGLQISPPGSEREATVPPFSEALADGTRTPVHP